MHPTYVMYITYIQRRSVQCSHLASVGQHDRSGRPETSSAEIRIPMAKMPEVAQLDAAKGAERNGPSLSDVTDSLAKFPKRCAALSQSKKTTSHGVAAAGGRRRYHYPGCPLPLDLDTDFLPAFSGSDRDAPSRTRYDPFHESSHYTFCRTRWLNRVFGMIRRLVDLPDFLCLPSLSRRSASSASGG